MADNKKIDLIDLVEELEKVDLSSLILPMLKIIDPIAKVVPEGFVKETLTHLKPSEGQFDYLDKIVPFMPRAIRVAGKVAAFKPVGIVFNLFGEGLSMFLRVFVPVMDRVVRILMPLISSLVGMVKGISSTTKRA
ncbi:MAG: hypothetical protein U9P80_04360 [Thermodesulfobacteriota bacterium]|nr:hypothetical protein [Thermodesulfobacteriota bacterium]